MDYLGVDKLANEIYWQDIPLTLENLKERIKMVYMNGYSEALRDNQPDDTGMRCGT